MKRLMQPLGAYMKTDTKRDILSAAMLFTVYLVGMSAAFGLSAAVTAAGMSVGLFSGLAILIVGATALANMIFKDEE